jgi:hypothetical protein
MYLLAKLRIPLLLVFTFIRLNCCNQAISPTITQRKYCWCNCDVTTTIRNRNVLVGVANCFTLTRTGIERTMAAVLGAKKEIPGKIDERRQKTGKRRPP